MSIKRLFVVLIVLASVTAAHAQTPERTVQQFYTWYFKNQATAQKRLPEQRKWLAPDLYAALASAYKKTPPAAKEYLEFDPFITLGDAVAFKVGQASAQGTESIVPVAVTVKVRGTGTQNLKIVLRRLDGGWVISNVKYPNVPDLRSQLKRVNGG